MRRIAPRRVFTGSFAGEQIQRTGQQVAQQVGQLDVSTDDRLTPLERRTRGALRYAMGNVNRVLTATQSEYPLIQFTGAHTAARTLTCPAATDDQARITWLSNATTGGFAITISCNGSTISLGSGLTRLALFWTGAPVFLI